MMSWQNATSNSFFTVALGFLISAFVLPPLERFSQKIDLFYPADKIKRPRGPCKIIFTASC
jgi:hypothetical protein